ncbi:hypothetical protein ENSA5_23850 [Enhygromyxa salina]|uniref:Cellulose-binding domain protein n=1 Tax=Enhygromyxa salina TaxID=215803 RepID=A0A2S9YB68_9BACT|nr:DUF1592 domain-containing protein [Enhygromyxa salina]PRQ02368.1 hypothetical protein ENSA5_23850 [Enhygromyxa salina]
MAFERWLPTLALLTAAGCYTSVNADEAGGTAGETVGDGGDADTSDGDGDGDGDGDAAELPSPSPRYYRLTHEQWENTVQDLFELSAPTGHSELFRADPQVAGFIFDNDATSLEIDEALWTGYRIAAGLVAEQVTDDPDLLAKLMPPEGPSEAERIETFVRSFGAKAYRRPLDDQEVATLTELFVAAPPYYSGVSDSFVAGVRHVIEATLQSPFFLYRIERSETIVDELVPLDDYEVAARLSYFLWNTMPDAELFDAAAASQLHTAAAVEAQAQRMIADPRAGDMVVRFHQQLLEAEKFETISPSPNFFPDAPADLGELAAQEHEHFIRDIVYGGGGGLAELLTSSETFVNDDLADIYGVPGVNGDEFTFVELDPSQRKGVFTQVGFLAANSTSVDPDPIHRGVFLAKRMSCLQIAAPPDGIPPLPPLEPDQTNRERVAAHTSADQCATCHATLINPYGFPFESYDAIGAWRTIDNGQPVDTTASPFVGEQAVAVAGALELVEAMAASEAIHECYTMHWAEYAAGRNAVPDDWVMIQRLGEASLAQQQSIQELLVALTTAPAFLNRAAEELP